jgi:hypothetical protein
MSLLGSCKQLNPCVYQMMVECGWSASQAVKQSSQLVFAREVGRGVRGDEKLSNKSDAPLRPVSRRIILLGLAV